MNESISYNQKISALIVTFLLGLLSCNITLPSSNNDTEDDSTNMTTSESGDKLVETVCYLSVNGRDSIHMELTIDPQSVNGRLEFDNYQIDDSQGILQGTQKGDTLWLTYDFMAEGMHSVTEEVFLMQGQELVRGHGERVESEGVYRYQSPADVHFEEGQVFHLTNCK